MKKHYTIRILTKTRFTEEILFTILATYINLKNYAPSTIEENLNNLTLKELKDILIKLQKMEEEYSPIILLAPLPSMKAMLVVRNLGVSVVRKASNEFVERACQINQALLNNKHSDSGVGLVSMVKSQL